MRYLAVTLISLATYGCGLNGSRSQVQGPAKHYHLTGRVVSVNAKDQSASIDAAAIPGYMEAMTMDYPVTDRAEFDKLKPGDRIEGTLDVYQSGDYHLTKVEKHTSATPTSK